MPPLDWEALKSAFRQVPLTSLMSLVLLQLLTQLLLNFQWCSLGKALHSPVNFNTMFYINSQGTLLETVTPGAKVGGEVVRVLLLKNVAGYSAARAVSLVTIQKLFSFCSFFLLSLAALFHITHTINFPEEVLMVKVSIYIALIGLLILFLVAILFPQPILAALKKRKANSFLIELFTHISTFKQNRGAWWKQFGLSVLIWLLFPVKFLLLVKVFSYEADFLTLAGIALVSYLAAMIPLTPGGLGSFEVTMSTLLILLGFQASDVVVITLLFRFITFWFVVLLSFLFVVIWKILFKENKLHEQVNQIIL